jgi:hypothetical protein
MFKALHGNQKHALMEDVQHQQLNQIILTHTIQHYVHGAVIGLLSQQIVLLTSGIKALARTFALNQMQHQLQTLIISTL